MVALAEEANSGDKLPRSRSIPARINHAYIFYVVQRSFEAIRQVPNRRGPMVPRWRPPGMVFWPWRWITTSPSTYIIKLRVDASPSRARKGPWLPAGVRTTSNGWGDGGDILSLCSSRSLSCTRGVGAPRVVGFYRTWQYYSYIAMGRGHISTTMANLNNSRYPHWFCC
jgi:hypothetical protein